MFEDFLKAFPQESKLSVDCDSFSSKVENELGCIIPGEIKDFWKEVGCGYFGDRVLYFFCEQDGAARDSLLTWNQKDFWRSIYPSPADGGPVFFAETCFGDQLGFRWEKTGEVVYILFSIDTFDAFSVTRGSGNLFSRILTDRYALLDESRYDAVRAMLGPLETGMHYAPIINPMIGGSADPSNFAFETPNVHFRTATATFLSNRS